MGSASVKLSNLQSLRAIAAINVVMFHTLGNVARTQPEPGALAFLSGWGANGVDIFFVLSGFVIYLSQVQNPKTPGRFLWNRVIRIVPNYWAWTLLLFGAFTVAPQLFPRMEASTGHLVASLLFISQPLIGAEPVFYVGWTLEYEMLFYALFCISLWTRVPHAPLFFIPAALLLLALVAGLPLIALEFLFGVVIARAFLVGRPVLPPVLTFVAGVVGLLASIVIPIPGGRIVEWGIPAALLVHGAVFLPEWKSVMLRFLGDASYSIYLIQVVSIPVALKLTQFILPQLPSDILTMLIVTVTVIVGVLNYIWFEWPIWAWLRAISRRTRERRYA